MACLYVLFYLPDCASVKRVEKPSVTIPYTPSPELRVKAESIFRFRIARWYGFKQAACSLTFDDGTLDQYVLALPELEKRNLKATFFLITKFVRRGYWIDSGVRRELFSWDKAREIYHAGHEIGSHTKTHADTTNKETNVKRELKNSYARIKRELSVSDGLTLAWPYWRSTKESRNIAAHYYIAARSGSGVFEKYVDKNGVNTAEVPGGFYSVNSFGIRRKELVKPWEWYCSRMYTAGGWFVLNFHGITDPSLKREWVGWAPLTLQDFRYVLDYVVQEGFWIAPFGTVARYARERESAMIFFLAGSDTEVVFTLEDGLDDEMYNQPLSLEVIVPASWHEVKVTQAGRVIAHRQYENHIYCSFLSDSSDIVIQRVMH